MVVVALELTRRYMPTVEYPASKMDREALIHRKDHGNEDGNGRESRFSDGNGFMNEATVTFLNDNLFQQEEEPEEEDDSESTDPPPGNVIVTAVSTRKRQ